MEQTIKKVLSDKDRYFIVCNEPDIETDELNRRSTINKTVVLGIQKAIDISKSKTRGKLENQTEEQLLTNFVNTYRAIIIEKPTKGINRGKEKI